jgi:hypothetical protein
MYVFMCKRGLSSGFMCTCCICTSISVSLYTFVRVEVYRLKYYVCRHVCMSCLYPQICVSPVFTCVLAGLCMCLICPCVLTGMCVCLTGLCICLGWSLYVSACLHVSWLVCACVRLVCNHGRTDGRALSAVRNTMYVPRAGCCVMTCHCIFIVARYPKTFASLERSLSKGISSHEWQRMSVSGSALRVCNLQLIS